MKTPLAETEILSKMKRYTKSGMLESITRAEMHLHNSYSDLARELHELREKLCCERVERQRLTELLRPVDVYACAL